MIIAVDFDGTIVEHKYPKIGKELRFAFSTLKELKKQGHQLILWTVRTGKELDEAVEYCKQNGVEFYAVNKNFPEEESLGIEYSRKLQADLFIDDRNLGGFPGWSKVWEKLSNGTPLTLEGMGTNESKKEEKSSFFSKIFNKTDRKEE